MPRLTSNFLLLLRLVKIDDMAPSKEAFSFAPPTVVPSPFSFSAQPTSQPSSSQPLPPFSFGNGNAFASKTSKSLDNSTPADSMDEDVEEAEIDEDQDGVDTLYLQPAAWSRNGKIKWKATGRTLMAAVRPVGGEVLAWVAKKVR